MIRVRGEGIWFSYPGGDPVLRGADLTIRPGEFLALVGPNGSGKSTLAMHLNRLLRPQRGSIALDGENIDGRSSGELASEVGYVFQNPDHMLFGRTVSEELALGPRYRGWPEGEISAAVEDTLVKFNMEAVARRGPASLDFGTRRVVSVAAVTITRPQLVILDEPTGGLDWGRAVALMDRIADLHRAGHGVLLITHDMRLVARYAQRTAVMRQGVVVAEGETLSILRDQELLASSQLNPTQIIELALRLGLEGSTIETVCGELMEQMAEAHG